MLLEVKNIIKELQQEVLKELFELNRAYPFGQIKYVMSRGDEMIDDASCSFKGKDGLTYEAQLVRLNYGEDDEYYTFEFYANDYRIGSTALTHQNDPFMIFSTVAKILIDMIESGRLSKVPIHINGTNRTGEEGETARDRIYKQMIKKNINILHNYKFYDLGKNGMKLVPE